MVILAEKLAYVKLVLANFFIFSSYFVNFKLQICILLKKGLQFSFFSSIIKKMTISTRRLWVLTTSERIDYYGRKYSQMWI